MASVSNIEKTQKYSYMVEGIVLTLFGFAAVAWPGKTFLTFTVLFGLYALVAGLTNVVKGIVSIKAGWTAVVSILVGAVSILAGSYVLNQPKIAAVTLVSVLGFLFIFRGIVDIVVAFSEKVPGRALITVGAVFGIIVGLVLLRTPVDGGLVYTWVLGLYALVTGPIMIALGIDDQKA